MVRLSLLALAEAVVKEARKPRIQKQAIELTDAAANRIRQLLEMRHKVCAFFVCFAAVGKPPLDLDPS